MNSLLKVLSLSTVVFLVSCGSEGSSSSHATGLSISSTSTGSRIALNTPNVLRSNDVIFWNDVGGAVKYDIYKGESLLGSTTSSSYSLKESGDYIVKAIPSEDDKERCESKASEVISYKKIEAEDIFVIDATHTLSTYEEYSIPANVDYVKIINKDNDSNQVRALYNAGFVVANRTTPLTIDFDLITYVESNFPDKYFIRYQGRQAEMPLLSLYFPTGGEVNGNNNLVKGKNGAYNDYDIALVGKAENGGNGGNGNTLAKLNNILLRYGGDLVVTGGKGSDGGRGGNRQTYGDAGDGGNGGNGAASFEVTDNIYSLPEVNNATLELKGGDAGKAGAKGESAGVNTAKNGNPGTNGQPYIGRLVNLKYPSN